MRKSRILAISAVGIAAVLALGACSSGNSSSSGGSSSTIGKVDGKGKTLTVWAMTGDYSPKTLKAVNNEFTKKTGAKVNVQTQQWTNIVTKVTTALATSSPPDVLDLGNTQVATFAASGGLENLASYKKDLEQGQTWIGGLEQPGTVNGDLYGVPGFASARAVIYNKPMWAAAGVTAAPTTYAELLSDLDKVKAKNPSPNFSTFYMPGQYWYAGMQWVWDRGGKIATQKGKKWTAGFSTAAAQKGLKEWQTFQHDYSSVASRSLMDNSPAVAQVFADGQTSAMLENPAQITQVEQLNPKITANDMGTFPMPGLSGKNQPAMIAGSDWGIAQKSKNQDLARAWVKIAASPSIQKDYIYGVDGWIPNSVQASKAALASSSMTQNDKAFFVAAEKSTATPASGNWASLEQPGFQDFFQTIATGSKSLSSAASAWDSTVNSTLNQK